MTGREEEDAAYIEDIVRAVEADTKAGERAAEIARGIVQSFIGPDGKVRDMKGLIDAIRQAIEGVRQDAATGRVEALFPDQDSQKPEGRLRRASKRLRNRF